MGCTVGGMAMVTRVPPGRTSSADRSRMSPPMTSNTTSTSPTSSQLRRRPGRGRPRAPRPSAPSRSAARPVPITRAPASRASWTAIEPTPPAAPWMRTVWPSSRRAWSNSPCHAVSPEMGSAAATVWSMSAARGARLRASTAVYSARDAVAGPVGQSEHPLARRSGRWFRTPSSTTVPDSSCPGMLGRPVTAGAIGPRCRPVELAGGEAPGVHAHDDVVLRSVGVGQCRSGTSRPGRPDGRAQ